MGKTFQFIKTILLFGRKGREFILKDHPAGRKNERAENRFETQGDDL
jgi:hypothetical protein